MWEENIQCVAAVAADCFVVVVAEATVLVLVTLCEGFADGVVGWCWASQRAP